MVILIDGSEKTQGSLWANMKIFTLGFVDNLRIKRDLFRVGVAQFSSKYKKEFYLNEHFDEGNVTLAIKKMTPMKYKRNIGAALNEVQEFFKSDKGSRIEEGISQNLLLITVGTSSDNVTDAANVLKAMGIQIFAIGTSVKTEIQLTSITGSHNRVFVLDSFDHQTVNHTTQMLINAICTSPSNYIKPGEYVEDRILEYKY